MPLLLRAGARHGAVQQATPAALPAAAAAAARLQRRAVHAVGGARSPRRLRTARLQRAGPAAGCPCGDCGRRGYAIPAAASMTPDAPGAALQADRVLDPDALPLRQEGEVDLSRELRKRHTHLPPGLEHPSYLRGCMAYTSGHWDRALEAFLECDKDPACHNSGPVLLMLGKCLIELRRFQDALTMLRRCTVLHASQPGVADALEEAEWGELLWSKYCKWRDERMAEMRAKQEKGVTPQEFTSPKPITPDLLDHGPLEPEQREWLRNHLGRAIEHVGVTYDVLKGRCVVAKQPIKKGTVIFRDTSVLFAPEFLSVKYDDKKWDRQTGLLEAPGKGASGQQYPHRLSGTPSFCSHCRKKVHGQRVVPQCSHCGLVYCSKGCQEEAQENYHLIECSVLQMDGARVLRDRLASKGELGGEGTTKGDQMLRRWLAIVRSCSVALQQAKQWPPERPWFSFLSYREGEHKRLQVIKDEKSVSGSTDMVPTGYGLLWLACGLQFYDYLFGSDWRKRNDVEVISKAAERQFDLAYDKVKANLTEGNAVLYPFFSLINHSCLPNARIDLAADTLVATEDINEGDEITISYIPKNIPVELKSLYIREKMGWTCHCLYCAMRFLEDMDEADAAQGAFGERLVRERREHKENFVAPTDTMPDGKLTLQGHDKQQKEQLDIWERRFANWDPDFRYKLQEQMEATQQELEGMNPQEVQQFYQQHKRKVEEMDRLGLYRPPPEDRALADQTLADAEEMFRSKQQLESTADRAQRLEEEMAKYAPKQT